MPGPTDAPDGRLPLPAELSPRGRGSHPAAPRSRGRRVARVASWTAVTASVLVLVLSGAAFAYYEHLNGNVSRVPVFSRITGHRPAEAADGAENILVVGSDSRNGQTAAQLQQERTTTDGGAVNTDTIIIVHLAPHDGPATLISIPRDSYVPIPGHGVFKVNAAYADGENDQKGNGPALLTQTVENLSGLHIDHFVSVGFGQFIDISNAIGGVKVCVINPDVQGHGIYDGGAYDQVSEGTGLRLTKGVHTISGPTALAFVRQRKNLPDGDLDRIHRQQRFITGVVQKASHTTNPLTINQVLEKATVSLTVDSGLSGTALARLAARLKGLKPAYIRYATVPVANEAAMSPAGVSYVQLDMARLQTFFANVQAERDPYAVPPTPTASGLTPADVTVSVLNGSGVAGGAGKARTALQGYGYGIASLGNTDQTASTAIRYNPADAGAAAELRKAVPAAKLVSDATVTAGTVDLVLGGDVSGTQDPATAPSSAKPAPSPTGSAPAPGTTTAGSLIAGKNIDGVPCGP